ncbi:Protein SIEVE ELEMENT OCCLUSION B [Camellia lanceoleosa]|uniref:Protein SIEVE ELEMENT OCCLUSION B n=1 Tax=Camellia lanceoleosa TaxID=1840588 RepID=A0ACC0IZ85_9ERIC|nr:Protein SIEVE ELEMENT OCCLUSION B [Camellia lanceoleosa]
MAMSKMTPGSMQQLIKGDRNMLMTSNDNIMMKQIQGTHNPDGREIDVKPILHIVEDILSRTTMQVETSIVPSMGVQGHMETLEEKGQQAGAINMLEALSFIIDRLSSEIAYKCLGGMDGHQVTVSLFTVLSNYSWDAKLVLALAAFALSY